MDKKDWIIGFCVPIISTVVTIVITVLLVQWQIEEGRKDVERQIEASRNQELLANYQERIIEQVINNQVIDGKKFPDCRRSPRIKIQTTPTNECDKLILALTSYTGSVMRTLDSTQNSILLLLLQDLNLVQKDSTPELLVRVNLSSARLNGAYLANANLYRANLNNAELKETNLTDTYFRGANLKSAKLWNAEGLNTSLQLTEAYTCDTELGSPNNLRKVDNGCEGEKDYTNWIKLKVQEFKNKGQNF